MSIRDAAPIVPGGDGLEHLTFRQLLASKSLARRRMRGKRSGDAHRLYWRIEAELKSRRRLKWSNIKSDLPDIPALDEQANEESAHLRPFGWL